MTKTNAMRLLEQAGISYQAIEYEVDENDLSGVHVAEQIKMPVEQVFKTLVAQGEKKGLMVFCLPVAEELNLKKVASIVKDKKIELVPVKDLLGLTGYIRGGCSPVGMKKKYPTYMDESCILWEEIAVSAGARGHQMVVPPEDLANLINAKLADITL